MIEKIIPSIIFFQILVGLFHAGIGIEEWRNFNIYDSQTLFIFSLSMGSFAVYLRLKKSLEENRNFGIIFEHAAFIGIISWFFYSSWGIDWEVFFVIFIVISLIFVLLLHIIESQTGKKLGLGNWGLPGYFWSLGSLLTLINTVSISLIFILLHQELSSMWIFFGISWFFLGKKFPL